jgi:hypothetical protein
MVANLIAGAEAENARLRREEERRSAQVCPSCNTAGGMHGFGCPEGEAPRRYWGTQDPALLFNGASVTTIPLKQAPFAKGYDTALVREAVSYYPRATAIAWLDPRALLATQPGIQRPALMHYLGRSYDLWGMPFESVSRTNRIPLVYTYNHPISEVIQHMVLVGHHRTCAALLRGELLMTRQVYGPVWPQGQRP